MVKLKDLRKKSVLLLEDAGRSETLADVDYLLIHLLGFGRGEIILGDRELDGEQEKVFFSALEKLLQGAPVQYVAGGCEFMSLWFEVNQATLIPRADTEILVEAVIDRLPKDKEKNILEVGTGSGCIAISLAHNLPKARLTAVDISPEALLVAQRNAKRNGVSERCKFLRQDIMQGFPRTNEQWDAVVSNPPYIPQADIETLEEKVKAFEPLTALCGGEDGLDFYRYISHNAPLRKGGLLAFEVGIGQAKAVARLMEERFEGVEILRDLCGIDRTVIGWLR